MNLGSINHKSYYKSRNLGLFGDWFMTNESKVFHLIGLNLGLWIKEDYIMYTILLSSRGKRYYDWFKCRYFTIWKKYIDFWMPRESIRSMNHKFIGTLNLVFDILLYFEFDYLVSPVYFRQARLDRLSYFFRKYIHHGVTRLPCCSNFEEKWYKSFQNVFYQWFYAFYES